MATDPAQEQRHKAVLTNIDSAHSSNSWEDRLAVLQLVDGLLRDLPSEQTVEHLIAVLEGLAGDNKWEIRRAVVPVLFGAGRPAARTVIERLTKDENPWVRRAAERARRKLARVTTSAEKYEPHWMGFFRS